MERVESFDFRSHYKDISESNIKIIQDYYNNKIQTVKSDSSIRRTYLALQTLCSMINEDTAPDFLLWNDNDVYYYMRESGNKSDNLRVLLNVIKDLLEISGNEIDISHIKNLTFCREYSSSIYTFKDLNTSLQETYNKLNPKIEWKCVNSWSTTIAICYLFWLGFIRKDIASLKISDYDIRTATIVLNKGNNTKRRQIAEQQISDYLERYIKAKDYYVYSDIHNIRTIPFLDTDSFIKTTYSRKSSILTIVDNHRRKIREYFGYTVDEIVDAGRMNRLYYLDKFQGLIIDKSNAEIIAKELDVPMAKRLDGTHSELGYLINLYPSYKFKREAISQ